MAETVGGLALEEELGDEGERKLFGVIEQLLSQDDLHSIAEAGAASASDDAVFMSTFIPRHLGEIRDPETHIEQQQADRGTPDAAMEPLGTTDPVSWPRSEQSKAVRFEEDETEPDEATSDSEGSEGGEQLPRGFKHEDKDAKRVNAMACSCERIADCLRSARRR